MIMSAAALVALNKLEPQQRVEMLRRIGDDLPPATARVHSDAFIHPPAAVREATRLAWEKYKSGRAQLRVAA